LYAWVVTELGASLNTVVSVEVTQQRWSVWRSRLASPPHIAFLSLASCTKTRRCKLADGAIADLRGCEVCWSSLPCGYQHAAVARLPRAHAHHACAPTPLCRCCCQTRLPRAPGAVPWPCQRALWCFTGKPMDGSRVWTSEAAGRSGATSRKKSSHPGPSMRLSLSPLPRPHSLAHAAFHGCSGALPVWTHTAHCQPLSLSPLQPPFPAVSGCGAPHWHAPAALSCLTHT
jgi:hypothetical protein